MRIIRINQGQLKVIRKCKVDLPIFYQQQDDGTILVKAGKRSIQILGQVLKNTKFEDNYNHGVH